MSSPHPGSAVSGSVYPELLRFISQLPGVKGMNDMNTLENSRKLQMSVAAPLSAPDNYPGFICSALNLFNISLRMFGHSWAFLGIFLQESHPLLFRRYLEMSSPMPVHSTQCICHIQHIVHTPNTPHSAHTTYTTQCTYHTHTTQYTHHTVHIPHTPHRQLLSVF